MTLILFEVKVDNRIMKSMRHTQSRRLNTFRLILLLGIALSGMLFTNVTKVQKTLGEAYSAGALNLPRINDDKRPY